jgi:HD-like signal output (HDOD) protein
METIALEKKLLQKVTDIATLPFVVRKLMSTLSNPRSSAKDLGRVIVNDQALSAKVLRLVNSAYYGLANEVTNINHAVAVLGFNSLRSLTLSIASHSAFFKGDGGPFFDRKKLWIHSLGTAICARVLARQFGIATFEDFFAAGLIHDVGKVIMDQYTPQLFHSIIMLAIKEKKSFYDAEKLTLSISHPEIGKAAAEKWCFPAFLTDAIRFHHEPTLAGNSWEAASIIHYANYLCKIKKIGENGDHSPPVLHPAVQKAVYINPRSLEMIYAEVDRDLKNSQAFIDML